MKYAIDIEGLSYRYPKANRNALEHIDFQVLEGSFFGLLGPNGAGKTTLISFLCGQIQASFQKANLLAEPWSKHKLIKHKLGYAPQEVALYPTLTAFENLQFFARFLNLDRTEVERVLDWVGLTSRAGDLVSTFSGGMKRRLNLGVALLGRPKVLILDEPTVGVDPQSRNFIFDKVIELKKEGVTVIYSTHYLEEVKKLCDHVGILFQGRVVTQGPIQKILGSKDLEGEYLRITGVEVEG